MIEKFCLLGMTLMISVQPARAESTFDREIAQLDRWLAVGVGSVIADIGAGSGEYAIALSRAVGDAGRVYASKLEEDDRSEIEEAARRSGAKQVEVIEAKIQGTGLER